MADGLRLLVSRALERHGESFDRWFPSTFDWQAVTADAPSIARGNGARIDDDTGSHTGASALARAAGEYFRLGYIGGLAILAAHDPESPDVEGTLDALADELDDEGEEEFAALVTDHLDAIEARLAGAEPALAAGTEALANVAALAWEPLAAWFEESPPGTRTRWRPHLIGYARLGAALAALRRHIGT